jgi:hypothetical protein
LKPAAASEIAKIINADSYKLTKDLYRKVSAQYTSPERPKLIE